MTAPNPPELSTLIVSLDGRLGRLVLNQPERLNPLGSLALRELAEAARWFDSTDAAVVVVSGAGRAFSAGFDLRELEAAPPPDDLGDGGARSTPVLGAEMAAAIGAMRAVTVAQVAGPCVGGAMVLALCCDLRVAADDAWFSLPEAELGIPLAWSGVPLLVRAIGSARAIDLILSCRRVAAAEAAVMGLVNEVVPISDLERAVDERVAVLLARRSTVIWTTKAQVVAAAEALVPTDGAWAGTDHLRAALRDLGS